MWRWIRSWFADDSADHILGLCEPGLRVYLRQRNRVLNRQKMRTFIELYVVPCWGDINDTRIYGAMMEYAEQWASYPKSESPQEKP